MTWNRALQTGKVQPRHLDIIPTIFHSLATMPPSTHASYAAVALRLLGDGFVCMCGFHLVSHAVCLARGRDSSSCLVGDALSGCCSVCRLQLDRLAWIAAGHHLMSYSCIEHM